MTLIRHFLNKKKGEANAREKYLRPDPFTNIKLRLLKKWSPRDIRGVAFIDPQVRPKL